MGRRLPQSRCPDQWTLNFCGCRRLPPVVDYGPFFAKKGILPGQIQERDSLPCFVQQGGVVLVEGIVLLPGRISTHNAEAGRPADSAVPRPGRQDQPVSCLDDYLLALFSAQSKSCRTRMTRQYLMRVRMVMLVRQYGASPDAKPPVLAKNYARGLKKIPSGATR